MTWSIIARDAESGKIGIAVATRFFAVGALVPHVRSGVGAVATQALVNPFFGVNGLKLLGEGRSAAEVVQGLVAGDAGRDYRQLHVMDAQGRSAAHTGVACVDWCGHVAGLEISVAGNMLAGPRVLEDTKAAYAANRALAFPRRLIAALRAGEEAGGDKRGKQSAALVIHGEEAWPDLDLRVDDHPDPLTELERLEQVSRKYFTHFMRFLPSRRDPVGVTDRAVIEREIAKAIAGERPA
ncbi:MAG: DUF1028 domain-containing protein [Xanthobacteraceae bacterium]